MDDLIAFVVIAVLVLVVYVGPFVAVGGLAWWLWRRHRAQQVAWMGRVEQLALVRLQEWPQATDEQIAQLVRDDLNNMRVRERAAFAYAVPETAGRVRRNVVRLAGFRGA